MTFAAHDCMDHSLRVNREGDDVLVEACSFCGKVRYETDGVRPMAWFFDPSNPVGFRYAYDNPRNDPNAESPWKYFIPASCCDFGSDG